MNAGCIYNIDLITNNKETYSVSSDDFNHFYIANINNDGDEINYNLVGDMNSLFANFFMASKFSAKPESIKATPTYGLMGRTSTLYKST